MKITENKYRIHRGRSLLMLLISIAVMVIIGLVVITEIIRRQDQGYVLFRYFTTISNIMASYIAILTIPYALQGLVKQQYTVPIRITRLLFMGTICVTITMLLALGILWPLNGNDAVQGYNFWCHIICPILIIVLFGLVSSEKPLGIDDCICATLPVFAYAIIYFIMVFVIGKEHGGWDDMYYVEQTCPIWLALILLVTVVFLITFTFRAIHNRLAKQRWKRFVTTIIQVYQPEDGTDLRFMLYEMGELMGYCDGNYEITVPIQLMKILVDQYPEYSLDDMVQLYMKGALNKIKHEN